MDQKLLYQLSLVFLLAASPFMLQGQEFLRLDGPNDNWEAAIRSSDGTLESIAFKDGVRVDFRTDSFRGPRWENIAVKLIDSEQLLFAGNNGKISYTLQYLNLKGKLALVLGMKNNGDRIYAPPRERFLMGINTEMVSYPDWKYVFFPTLLRCEKTHFWGYLMTPGDKILTIGSPDPVASYALQYEVGERGWGKHRIYTFSLDLLHAGPLPSRHPDLASLAPGEERQWTIFLDQASSLEEVKPQLAETLGVPMIDADRYSLQKGQSTKVTLYGKAIKQAKLLYHEDNGESLDISASTDPQGSLMLQLPEEPGRYKLEVTDANGHVAEASFSRIHPWSWYLDKARDEAIRNKQIASSHLEQWLGLNTAVNASLHIPNPEKDSILEQRLLEILDLQWDLDKKIPDNIGHRTRYMSNTAQMAGILAKHYMKNGDLKWLELASGFADYVVDCQDPEGYYRPHLDGKIIYTSIFYPAKSLMIVMNAEKMAAESDPAWSTAYERHYASVKKAMDHLVRMGDNIETEGQLTFEDGMIASSSAQLGLFALLQQEQSQREHYAKAARHFLNGHQCLEQLLIPDSRMNGATIRFWEAQYDILIRGSMNMVNSPHGWSAWVIPGLWYQYLLTGEEHWLREAMNALGTCAQVIDFQSGELRWGFIVDPHLKVTSLVEDPENPGRGKRVAMTIGEQYMPMISSFHNPDSEPVSGNSELVGWTCDNDVHEIFTAVEEVALTSCYLLQRENGELVTWNCTATVNKDGSISVAPAESLIGRLHVNLITKEKIRINHSGRKEKAFKCPPGMDWIEF